MSNDLAKKFYVGQPVWLIREFKVEAFFIGDLEKSVTLITTKVPGPETRYRVAGDGSALFTNEVEAIKARQDILRAKIKELKILLEEGLIEKCSAERREDTAKKNGKVDDSPSP
jgi:hypothetical protein